MLYLTQIRRVFMNDSVYNDESAFEIISKINKTVMIPDFQREFIWSTSDIEELFKSIIEGFPIGSFIIWRTKGMNLNESPSSFYKFLDSVKRIKSTNIPDQNVLYDKNYLNDGEYDIVLDGQQRLTSIYIALMGFYLVKKSSSRRGSDREYNFHKKELYYNLDRYVDDEKPFAFLTEDETQDGNYYKVKELMRYVNDRNGFCEHIGEITNEIQDKRIYNELINLYDRLNENSIGKSLIHYFTIKSERYDDALNIFVRVNSTGKPLNKTDLLFSSLINNWQRDPSQKQGRRKEISNFISQINEKYNFAYDRNFLLRFCLVLTTGKSSLLIGEFNNGNVVEKIRENWNKIRKCLEDVSKAMRDIDLNSEKIISYNAIMPIAYYLFLGGKFPNNRGLNTRNELKKFFAIAFAKGLFGGSSDSTIKSCCDVVRVKVSAKEQFSLSYFDAVDFSGGRNTTVDITLINKWLSTYQKGKKTYLPLLLLSPNLNVLENDFDQDHSHADVLFEEGKMRKRGIDSSKFEMWKSKRNLLPNLSFMQSERNRSKNKDDLSAWIKNNPDKVNSLRSLPVNISYAFENFEQFFILRRSMMKYTLTTLFEVQKEEIKVGDEVTINADDKTLEINYGMHGEVVNLSEDSVTATVNLLNEGNTLIKQVKIATSTLYLVESFDKNFDAI